jgi:hypothetical protein
MNRAGKKPSERRMNNPEGRFSFIRFPWPAKIMIPAELNSCQDVAG